MENCDTGPPVVTVMVCPVAAEVGAVVMVGRTFSVPLAFNRYGGVKICPSGWLVEQNPHSPPPPENTRPSGRRTATEW